MLTMDTAARIKQRMEALGMDQHELAKAVGVSQPAIHKLVTGKTRYSRHITAIAAVLGTTADYLEGRTSNPTRFTRNIEPGPDIAGRIPLISWVAAGQWAEVVDNYAPGEAEKFIYTTAHVGPHAFALRVKGDSMENPYGKPSYPEGCIIIVDPDRSVVSGARVVARLDDVEEATFKVYVEDAGRRFLKPLNPQYPTLAVNSHATICGVVVQTIIEE